MRAFINGRWTEGEESFQVLNPYNNQPIGSAPLLSSQDVRDAVEGAKEGLTQMESLTPYERYQILQRAAQGFQKASEKLTHLLSLEVGKTIREAKGEVSRAIQTVTLSSEEAKRLSGEVVPFGSAPNAGDRIGFYLRVPLGVVAAITPFNFPLNLALHKVAPALAAGDSVILKPASDTPLTSELLCQILLEAGLPPKGISLVTGKGEEVGEALVRDDRVRMITFTGSLDVGERIMQGLGMKKATMELGSNSAVIVERDAILDEALPRIRDGAFALAGQVCISVQRVYVQQGIYDDFLEGFVPLVKGIKPGDPLDEATDMGPMISPQAARRAREWVEEAMERGGKLLTGGGVEGCLMEPTVLTQVPSDCKVSSQEAFAPLVVVNPYGELEEAIEEVNNSRYGLQAGIYTQDLDQALTSARKIEVGGVIINDIPTFRVDLMPYGGVKGSGLGREGPKYAIEELTELKLVSIRFHR